MYSARIGRFLSVGPLHELMPSHNPYHYAFNSPLVWKDPSGLAPEKDKNIHSEKFQGQFIKLRDLSTPIMPGDEYWVYIKDDRDFYFSAEYDAGFADDSHLRSLGGHGSGGGSGGGVGSGRSLRSTQAFGPRTHDPNKLLNPEWKNMGPLDFDSKFGFVVNEFGELKEYNKNYRDQNIYYLKNNGTLVTLGKIGGTLSTEEIIDNILDANTNTSTSKNWIDLSGFYKNVRTGGDWDYKNKKTTMFGLLNGTGTLFAINGYGYMNSEDFGNFHFGIVSNAWGYSPGFSTWGAGMYQIYSNTSPFVDRYSFFIGLINGSSLIYFFMPPFGDDPWDYMRIIQGFKYYNSRYGE